MTGALAPIEFAGLIAPSFGLPYHWSQKYDVVGKIRRSKQERNKNGNFGHVSENAQKIIKGALYPFG